MIFNIAGHTGDLLLAMPAINALKQDGHEVKVHMNPRFYAPVENIVEVPLVTDPKTSGNWKHLHWRRGHITDAWVYSLRKQGHKVVPYSKKSMPEGDYILIQPWAEDESKMFHPSMWRAVVESLAGASVVVGAPGAYHDTGEYIVEGFPNAVNYCGKDSGKWATTVAKASKVISIDSGAAHLADYLGKDVLVLFKSTDPKVWAPTWSRKSYLSNPSKDELAQAAEKLING